MSLQDLLHPIKTLLPQHQDQQPGEEGDMIPEPRSFMEHYKPAGKLQGKTVLITGGDSGIGRAVSIGCAKEGADIAIIYLEEDEDAHETRKHIEVEGQRCLLIEGDISDRLFCEEAVKKTMDAFGSINILINNAAQQYPEKDFTKISMETMHKTFEVNIFPLFYLTQAVIPHMKEGDSIINTASITAYQGHEELVDYASTKGAIVAFTRSLALNLADKKIRVNGVAPGPIWTPLIPASFDRKKVMAFGKDTTMKRPGQPDEVAPAFIFLASDDASYFTGQFLHPNGGSVVNA